MIAVVVLKSNGITAAAPFGRAESKRMSSTISIFFFFFFECSEEKFRFSERNGSCNE